MYVNLSQKTAQDSPRSLHLNCSNVSSCGCSDNSSFDATSQVYQEVEIEAFFYIVVVIVFYATSIVLLLVKYARNDDEEETLKYQYSEFVKRERFQAPRYKNKVALERTKAVLKSLELSNGDTVLNCPMITISNYTENGDSHTGTVSALLAKPMAIDSLSRIGSNIGFGFGTYDLSPCLDPEPLERSTSLCLLSYDTDLELDELTKKEDCDDSEVCENIKVTKSSSF